MSDRNLHPDVERMISQPGTMTPTARLDYFVPAYEKDNNLWWMIDKGHCQNLFEAAIDLLEEMGWQPNPNA